MFERYLGEVTPEKRSAPSETYRIKAMMKRSIAHRTLAMRPAKDRDVTEEPAARDLDLYENVLRKWVRETSTDPSMLRLAERSSTTFTASRVNRP